MTGKEIVNQVIEYSTPELDTAKNGIAAILDKMLAAVPALQNKGMSNLEIFAQADGFIRSQLRRILNGNEDFMVERHDGPALFHWSASVTNMIIDRFKRAANI